MYNTFTSLSSHYLSYIKNVKNLSPKSIEAYSVDLNQFISFTEQYSITELMEFTPEDMESYFEKELSKFSPRSVKRKLASLKVFFKYVKRKNSDFVNPFHQLEFQVKVPKSLPRYMTKSEVKEYLQSIYDKLPELKDKHKFTKEQSFILRDVCIVEVLFCTGLRVSELVQIRPKDIDYQSGRIIIYGKGGKERVVFITNSDVLELLRIYAAHFKKHIEMQNAIFVNNRLRKISTQTVRHLITKYDSNSENSGITPHTFRHTCASLLLQEGANLRLIQKLLGHASITTTELYTHIDNSSLKSDLQKYHPRNIDVRFIDN